MWLIISADHAPKDDRDTIVEMRESVARHLTREQLAEAQKLAQRMEAEEVTLTRLRTLL